MDYIESTVGQISVDTINPRQEQVPVVYMFIRARQSSIKPMHLTGRQVPLNFMYVPLGMELFVELCTCTLPLGRAGTIGLHVTEDKKVISGRYVPVGQVRLN